MPNFHLFSSPLRVCVLEIFSMSLLICIPIAQGERTALSLAAEYGHIACVRALIQAGANTKAKDEVRG